MASQAPRTGQAGGEAGPPDQNAIPHKPLHQLYDDFANMYKQIEESADLDNAIRELQDAITPAGGIERAKAHLRLAAALQERHLRTKSTPDRRASAALLLESANQVPDDHVDKAEMLHRSAGAYIDIFQQGRSLEDLALARRQLQEILRVAKADDPTLVKAFRQLAVVHRSEYLATKDLMLLDDVARCLTSALELTPKGHPQWLHLTTLLVSAAQSKYQRTGETDDLRTLIEHLESKLAVMPRRNPKRTYELGALGGLHFDLYRKTHELAALERSIDLFEDVLNQLPTGHPQRHAALYEQGKAYSAKSDATGEVAFLEVAARQFKHALDCVPKNDPLRVRWVPYASRKWHDLYLATKGMESLQTSIAFLEELLSFLPDTFRDRRDTMLRLVSLCLDRGQVTKTEEDLATASRRIRRLLSEMPEDDPERPSVLHLLHDVVITEWTYLGPPTGLPKDPGEGLYSRGGFGLAITEAADSHVIESLRRMDLKPGVEDAAETEEWIRRSEKVLNGLPSRSLESDLEFVQLGMTYDRLYAMSQSMDHIDQAIQCFQKGLEVGPGDSRARPILLTGLKSALWKKFYATQLDRDCDAAIEATRRSLAAGMNKRRDSAILGGRLRLRYLKTDNEADLDESLQMYQQLLTLTHPGDADRCSVLHGLGLGFFLRSQTRRALSDAAAAVRYLEQAVAACPKEDPRRSEYLGDLGLAYKDKATKEGGPGQLGKAIRRLLEAVNTADDNTQRKAISLYYLAEGYMTRYGEDQATSDLDLATDAYEKAVGLNKLDDDTKMHSYVLVGLGCAYLIRYEGTSDEETWTKAIKCLKQAVLLTSEGHHTQAAHLGHLAQGYHLQYHKTKRRESLQEALRNYEAALASSHCPPLDRIPLGKELFGIYVLLKDWASAYRTASTLLSIIPFALIRSLENADKKTLVAGLEGLACDAAAVALLAGERPFVALSLLETGRGIIMGSLLGLRSDIDQLQHEHPKLAAEYLRLRDKVDSVRGPLSNPAAEWLPIQRPDYRHNASKELEQAIDAIRDLPGFESFLRGPSEDEMKAAAATRPIVVINASRLRCDAIIVRASGIASRRLSGATLRTIREACQHITGVKSLKSKMLEWLWDKVAEPVMEALGLTSSPPERNEWPSVCWILTGPLVGLPLHAAGYHEASNGKTVLDRAISSYSVSVASLVQMHADRQKPGAHRKPEHAVLIGMPDLPNALKEVREVARISPTMQIHTPPPYTQDVLKALKTCDVFHFAGHGRSSREDPTSSALILSGAERLTVSSLFDINLHKRRPFLAFLSACNTGQIKHDTFMDEGLHLIAACQVAGFQHVIGTLWEVSDRLCVEAARGIYEWMHAEGLSHASVSEGLHRTCRKLRTEWVQGSEERRAKLREEEDIETDGVSDIEGKLRKVELAEGEPLLWVPYVHYGI